MTLIDGIAYVCPICGAKAGSIALLSTSAFGMADLDTRQMPGSKSMSKTAEQPIVAQKPSAALHLLHTRVNNA